MPQAPDNKLHVSYSMWVKPNYTAVIKGQRVEFKNLAEARDRAEREGYKGIKVN